MPCSAETWRRVSKRCPCSHSTLSDPNNVSLRALFPTVAAPARRAGDAVLLQHISEVVAGVLATPVAAEGEPGLLARMATHACRTSFASGGRQRGHCAAVPAAHLQHLDELLGSVVPPRPGGPASASLAACSMRVYCELMEGAASMTRESDAACGTYEERSNTTVGHRT